MSPFFEKALAVLQWIGRSIVSGPQTLWMLSEGHPISRGILYGGAGLVAVTILSLLVYYLRCIIKKKRENPGALIAVLLIVCGAFLLGARMKPAEAAPVTVDGVELLSSENYSLSRGRLEFIKKASVFMLNPDWSFAGDSFSFMTDENTLLQLSGLRTLAEGRSYYLSSAETDTPLPRLEFSYYQSGESESVSAELKLYVLKDRTLSEEPWFLDAGKRVRAASFCCFEGYIDPDGIARYEPFDTDYRILDNDGETLIFLMKFTSNMATLDGKLIEPTAVCMARQYGPDIVAAVSFAETLESGSYDRIAFDPIKDVEARAFLLEPLENLFDGNIRLIADPTDEMLALALPKSIDNCPCWFFDKGTRLSIPCSRLLAMTYDKDYEQVLRFIGPGPDGEECLYTLLNGRNGVGDEERARREEWNLVYKRDKTAVDSDMSQFLGAKAIRCDGGWVVKMGTFLGDSGASYDHYYHLTIEPVPQPTAAQESAEIEAEPESPPDEG